MKKFETNEEMIYSLIIDDLEQSISAADKKVLEEWRGTAAANEGIYQDFVNIQLNIDKLFEKKSLDPQLSWESLDKKISKAVSRSTGLWYKIAAAIAVTLSIGYYFLQNDKYEVVTNADTASVIRFLLPDGTELSMNAGTTIKYNKDNFETERKLILEHGEVFIHVTKHEGSQFSVDLGDVDAQDIGTSFNVSKNDKLSTVIVEEGKVALKHHSQPAQVVLSAGMLGMYTNETEQLTSMRNPDLNYKAWIDKKFTFREQPVEEVAAQLEKVYKFPLRIEGSELKLRKLTAKLHYQTLDSVLKVISASLQCKVVKEQNTYVLSSDQ